MDATPSAPSTKLDELPTAPMPARDVVCSTRATVDDDHLRLLAACAQSVPLGPMKTPRWPGLAYSPPRSTSWPKREITPPRFVELASRRGVDRVRFSRRPETHRDVEDLNRAPLLESRLEVDGVSPRAVRRGVG